jgi:hypothetical protein
MSLSIASALAFIAQADHYQLLRLRNAVDKKMRGNESPQLSTAQAKALFEPGTFIEIGHTTNDALNGAIAEVVEVQRTTITYIIGERKGRIPIVCAAPVDASEAASAPAQREPPGVSSFVALTGTGKFSGALGVVVKNGKRGFVVILTEGALAGACITAPHLMVEAQPKPAPAPHLLVMFKNEIEGRDPDGSVSILDTNKVKPTDLRRFGEKIDGIIEINGYLKLTEARILARGLGARFEST